MSYQKMACELVKCLPAQKFTAWANFTGPYIYGRETDILTIIFTELPIAESDEEKPNVVLDYDASGNLVSLEILDASQHISVPGKIEYQVSPSQT